MSIASIVNGDTARASARVGLVSPQGNEESALSRAFRGAGHDIVSCTKWDELTAKAAEMPFDLVLCDASLVDGMPADIRTPVIGIDGGGVDSFEAADAMMLLAIELAGKSSRLAELECVVDGIRSGDAIVGDTPVMRRLQGAVARAADCDATVLIEGPVGSGKSLAARCIHLKSRRAEQPVIVKDCATLSSDELNKTIAAGKNTTLVLESVDQLPANAQSALVKHLKERSTSRAPSLVRLVATTSAHIPEMVARGAFREDLFYRLHAFPIVVPGLHERVDDIQALADAILDCGVPSSGRNHQGFTPAARMLLESMQWPGNVAQLEAAIRRGQVVAGGGPIDRDHLMSTGGESAPSSSAPTSATGNATADEVELTEDCIRPFEEEEKFLLGRALQATKGNVRRAAQLLGIGRATLYRKIQQYHLRLH